jgi:hypothetical protein
MCDAENDPDEASKVADSNDAAGREEAPSERGTVPADGGVAAVADIGEKEKDRDGKEEEDGLARKAADSDGSLVMDPAAKMSPKLGKMSGISGTA